MNADVPRADSPYDVYSLARRFDIADRALKSFRVYLDTKYWAYCRDAAAGESNSSARRALWELLSCHARSGALTCPASEPIISELGGMESHSRALAACLIGQLSHGMAIAYGLDQFKIELSHWTWTNLLQVRLEHPVTHYVWVPILHYIGEPMPHLDGVSDDLQCRLQKSFLDYSYRVTVSDIADALGPVSETRRAEIANSMREMTLRSLLSREEYRSFASVYKAEVDGGLDGLRDAIYEFARWLWEKQRSIDLPPCRASDGDDSGRNLLCLLRSGLKSRRITSSLSACHIGASIHALIRWERQKYHPTDLYDFLHAAAAVPYCDVFLTDKRLALILKHKYLRLGEMYQCEVLHDDENAIEYLRSKLGRG